MSKSHSEPGKKLLSFSLAEWACGLKYEHLSPAAIERAKMFWYDSVGCGIGGRPDHGARQ